MGYLLLRVAGVDGWACACCRWLVLLALVSYGGRDAGSELATIRSSVQQASALVPDYGCLRPGAVVLALALARWRAADSRLQTGGLAARPGLCSDTGGRDDRPRRILCGLHMTVEMAVAS